MIDEEFVVRAGESRTGDGERRLRGEEELMNDDFGFWILDFGMEEEEKPPTTQLYEGQVRREKGKWACPAFGRYRMV